MPCDVDVCPYPLSPGGEGALWPQNDRAVWLWKRLKVVGPVVFDLIHWQLTADEAELLVEQLYELEAASLEFNTRYPEVKLLWDRPS